LATGEAVITGGGKLKAKYVIHTVGPIWHGGGHGEAEFLASAYKNSLILATEHELTSISFPSISTGAYGYPVQEAAEIAIGTTISFLQKQSTSLKEIIFVLFGTETLQAFCRVFENIL
jgi:O-acetyl-ADP-ribose deacetylase (regulator of RNase III)